MHRRALAHRPLLQASLSLLTALVVGCGGKVLVDGTGVDGAGGAGGAGNTTSTVSSNSTGTSTAQGTGGISTGPSTTTGPDTTATTTGTGPDTTATSTTSGPTTSSVTTGTGAGGSAPVPQVFCNGQPCNDGEICCFNLTMPTDHCGQAGTCGDGYIELGCNGPEDCPNNQICCAGLDPMQGMVPYTGIACQDSCQGMNTRIVCGDAGSAVCNPGDSCKNSQTLGNGYKICRP